MIRSFLAAVALLVLTGCNGMKIDDFAGTSPEFRPEQYFIGQTKAWGFFQDRFGKVRREFVVEIEGSMEGETLILDERFVYADGELDRRVWRIRQVGGSRYEGEADDIVGVAAGERRGKAMRWAYDFDLEVGESTWRVGFEDWMLQQDETVMINRATITKWGFTLGEVYIFFQKQPAAGSPDDGEAASEETQKAAE